MDTVQLNDQVEFNIIKTLKVIQNDKVLDELFREDNKDISYGSLYSMAERNSLDPELLDKAREIFDRVILKNQMPLDEYLKLDNSVSIEPVKKTKQRKLPKHYGKKRILEDIKANNETTELDRAMLALNTLRNITSKLRSRGVKDKLTGTKILTDLDCRDIIAAVRIVENKVSNILNKKAK